MNRLMTDVLLLCKFERYLLCFCVCSSDADVQDKTQPGFCLMDPTNRSTSPCAIRQLSPSMVALIRIFQELALLSCATPADGLTVVPDHSTLRHHLELDLEILSCAIGRNLEECVTALHLAVSKAAELPTDDCNAPDLSNQDGRSAYEIRLVTDWLGPLLGTLGCEMDNINQKCAEDDNAGVLYLDSATHWKVAAFTVSFTKVGVRFKHCWKYVLQDCDSNIECRNAVGCVQII